MRDGVTFDSGWNCEIKLNRWREDDGLAMMRDTWAQIYVRVRGRTGLEGLINLWKVKGSKSKM